MADIDKKHIVRGVEGGAIAGLAFGAMLGMTGILNFTAALTHAPVLFVFFVHILLSIIAGIFFSVVFGHVITTDLRGLVIGCVYGFMLWTVSTLLGLLIYKNIVDQYGLAMFLPSLWAHLIYGFMLGLVYDIVLPDNEQTDKVRI